ncbi:MAG: anti-sigma factor family protein [Rhizomicrobium sp.]
MIPRADIREEDLHALIDGELDSSERARIEAVVDSSPHLRDRLARFRADKARIGAIYGGGMSEPLPRDWTARIEASCARPRWHKPVAGLAALAAALLLLVFAGVVAWRMTARPPQGDVVAEALAARDGALRPQASVASAAPRALVAENRAMTQALDARIRAPDLSHMGYRLVGINEYAAPVRAFELRYADREGAIFTLYLRRSSGAPRFDQFGEHGLRVCVWQDNVIGMVMAGRVSVPEMQRLASLAYTGLEM